MSVLIVGHREVGLNTQLTNLRMGTLLKTGSLHYTNIELMGSLPIALIITKLLTACLTVGMTQMKCV